MSRKTENTGFVCEHCGRIVRPLTNGSCRNHCPFCLYSKHVDLTPGDRRNGCRGLMAPIALRHKSGKGFQIFHRCLRCGAEGANKVAQDTTQPDDIEELARLCC
jgi:DNA-directed RNA polymerase subunit RPC12/RpoP